MGVTQKIPRSCSGVMSPLTCIPTHASPFTCLFHCCLPSLMSWPVRLATLVFSCAFSPACLVSDRACAWDRQWSSSPGLRPTFKPSTDIDFLSEMFSPSEGQQEKRLTWMCHRRLEYGDLIEKYAALPGSLPAPDPKRGSIREWKEASKSWQFALEDAMQIQRGVTPIGSQTQPPALPPGVYERAQVMALLLRPPPHLPPERVGASDMGRAMSQSAAFQSTRFQQAFYRRTLAGASSG